VVGISVVEPWLWSAFIVGVAVLLLFDLFVLHRDPNRKGIKHAIIDSVFWIALALIFNLWFGYQYGHELGIEFLTGYVIEKSLSIDNLFVILLVFNSFGIKFEHQHRVLFWGIFGAVLMRGILILIGAKLVHEFEWILYIFGVILIVSGIKFLFESDEEKEVREHWVVRYLKRHIPISPQVRDGKFFVVEDGIRKATPQFLALFVIEATDLVFAVDSVPAVLAVTRDSFVAFASNVLAVLGLRALYFVIADFITRFRYLKPGLATVLCFVGVKMLIVQWYKIPSYISLLVISMVLLTAGLSSWYVNRRENARRP
jgi:tellurite resistance protein TerC